MSGFLGVRVFMGSMTNLGTAAYRRFVQELGAEGTIGEMALADRVAKGWKQDLVLLRHHPEERCFGAQVVGKRPENLVHAARLAQEQGARFVDLNCACPIRAVTDRGGGAALAKRPSQLAKAVEALREALSIPVTVKLRTGWTQAQPNLFEAAEAAIGAGASAVFVHGRSWEDRYRGPANWALIGELAARVRVPVIGSGDLLSGEDVHLRLRESGCAAVSVGRGGLIRPWLFKEYLTGERLDPDAETRLGWLRRLVALTLESFGNDEIGHKRAAKFLFLQLDFMSRHVPDAVFAKPLGMQERAESWEPRDELERLFASRDREQWSKLLSLAGFQPPTPNEQVEARAE